MNQVNEQDESIFDVVFKSSAKSKNKIDKVYIETAVRGLVYRTNVYLNDFLIDAKEVSCLDLATLENGQSVFKQRYLATHYAFEQQYFMDKVFVKVLSDKGIYIEGDGECVVNTYIFENLIKNEVLVDDYEIDIDEVEVDKDIVSNKKAFKNKYTKLHKECVRDNIAVEKFPVNTFLNPILKKYPLYDKNPMHAFYLFVASVILGLWLVSMIICGQALPKLAQKLGGREASLVTRDIQKTICIKSRSKSEEEKIEVEKKELIHEKLYKDGYLVLPEKVEFKENKYIKTVYVKNSLDGDLIVKINNKVIDNFNNPLVTPEMVINIVSKREIVIKSGDIGSFEFKIEDDFLQSPSIEEGKYTGRLILEIIKVKYNTIKAIPVEFTFNVVKNIKPIEETEAKKEKKE